MIKKLFKKILEQDQAKGRQEVRYCLEAKKKGFIKGSKGETYLWKKEVE